ncbi:scamp family-domain-containing protein [Rhodotorula diobovata]|uniref:Scamp family-domain-containing protein n=1 Tax=Rhodotorula diobovata TaxID=5288 RepID=A0A5C5G3D2_9BASI|nr:scamp family-domain-containing protein [Rhodotorula diobovata]
MSNPFADPTPQSLDSNPFADPAVQAGLQSRTHDDYQPSSKSPSPYPLDDVAPPAPGQDVQARLEDLQRRERELAARESALTQKQEHIRKHGRNNWPHHKFPLLFHSIDEEIPAQHQAMVLTLYRIWMFFVLVLTVNLVGGVLLTASGSSNGDLGAGIVYLPVMTVLSFLLWYRPVYNAYAKEYSFFYYIFFLFGGFHIAFCVYSFVGVPSSGSAGLINTISSFAGGHIAAGVVCTVATVGWALEAAAFTWAYKNVHAHSSGEQGHTLSQAKQEIQMYGLKAYLFRGNSMPASSQQQQGAQV